MFKIGGWNVSPTLNRLERNGETLKLEPRVMDLLIYLASARGRVVSADELLREVWKGRVFDDGVVYKNINHLRKALKDDSHDPRFIQTIPKRGYCLVATVERDEEPQSSAGSAGHPVVLAMEADSTVAAANTEARTSVQPSPRSRRWLMPAAAAVIGIVALGGWALWRNGDVPVQIGSAGATLPLTSYPGDEVEPSWSPDGQRVAFVRRTSPEGSRIEVAQLGTAESLRLTEATQEKQRTPRWSPTGNRIAFLRQRDITNFDLVVVDALDRHERTLGSVTIPLLAVFDAMPFLTWTPYGEGLVFTTVSTESKAGPSHALHLLSLDTGAIRSLGLAGSSDEYDTSPTFSPDGRRLAFVRYRDNERLPRLMVQELGDGFMPRGPPQAVQDLPPPASVPRSPTWADNETLMFSLGLRIVEWRAGSKPRVVYTLPPSLPGGLDISWRDGRARVVVSLAKGNLDLWELPIDPVTHLAVGPPAALIHSTAIERHPSFSRDGRLAYTSSNTGREELYVSSANGGAQRRLSEIKAGILSNPRWSPDGTQLAFFAVMPPEGKFVVHVVDIGGGMPRRIYTGGIAEGWSADGQYIYAGRPGTPSMTVRLRVSDGHEEELFEGGGAVETVDGADVLYSKRGEWGIFARSLTGFPGDNPERQLVDDYTPARAAIVPTVGGFYYLGHTPDSEPRAFEFFDFRSQTRHDVAQAPSRIDIGMTLSPAGDKLVYPAPGPGDDFDLAVLEFERR